MNVIYILFWKEMNVITNGILFNICKGNTETHIYFLHQHVSLKYKYKSYYENVCFWGEKKAIVREGTSFLCRLFDFYFHY